jgi:cytochrome c biogenesis protein CcmG/thiol:disulfide interchange protein DsbE
MKRAALILIIAALACRRETLHPAAPPQPKKSAAKPAPRAEPPPPRTESGDAMPAYKAEGVDGPPFDLAQKRGKVVLLNVWATWCGPCVFEIPHLNELQKTYGPRGFEVVGVSVDDTGVEPVREFVKQRKIGYAVAIDPEGHIANLLQTTVLPTSVLIGKNGKIVWRQAGAITDNDDAKLKPAIEKALE